MLGIWSRSRRVRLAGELQPSLRQTRSGHLDSVTCGTSVALPGLRIFRVCAYRMAVAKARLQMISSWFAIPRSWRRRKPLPK